MTDQLNPQLNTKKMGTFERSYKLSRSAWQVLKLEKSLLSFTMVGCLIQAGIISAFVAGLGFYYGIDQISQWSSSSTPNQLIVPSAVLLIITTFIGSFIYGAVSYGAIERFKGNDPTLKSCFHAAYRKINALLLFSILSATIGFILNLIEERVPWGGKIAVWITGAAWSLASMFAVPFIVTSDKSLGPIEATKQSASLIKKVWGEYVVVSVGVGILAALIVLPYIMMVTFVSLLLGSSSTILLITSFGFGAVGLIILLGVFNVLSSIVQASIFYWATTGEVPKEFDKELLQAAMTPKKARKVFA